MVSCCLVRTLINSYLISVPPLFTQDETRQGFVWSKTCCISYFFCTENVYLALYHSIAFLYVNPLQLTAKLYYFPPSSYLHSSTEAIYCYPVSTPVCSVVLETRRYIVCRDPNILIFLFFLAASEFIAADLGPWNEVVITIPCKSHENRGQCMLINRRLNVLHAGLYAVPVHVWLQDAHRRSEFFSFEPRNFELHNRSSFSYHVIDQLDSLSSNSLPPCQGFHSSRQLRR